jgi:two-component system sensor histidine kinase FlrB
MQPTSHFEPINPVRAAYQGEDEAHALAGLHLDKHPSPLRCSTNQLESQESNAAALAGEFSEFISAASRLETSYRELQGQVSELGLELSERNSALNQSLAENERMRLALQQIVDSMPCGVLVLDHNGEISMLNPESGRLLRLDPGQFGAESHATLRQITAVSGVNLELSCPYTSGSQTEHEYCVRDCTGKRWIEVRI